MPTALAEFDEPKRSTFIMFGVLTIAVRTYHDRWGYGIYSGPIGTAVLVITVKWVRPKGTPNCLQEVFKVQPQVKLVSQAEAGFARAHTPLAQVLGLNVENPALCSKRAQEWSTELTQCRQSPQPQSRTAALHGFVLGSFMALC